MEVARVNCPVHDDDTPSMVVYADGHAYCYGCGYWEGGYAEPVHWEPKAPAKPTYVPWSLAFQYANQLGIQQMKWLTDRGLTLTTIQVLRFGYTGRAYSIPVWDRTCQLQTIRFRRDDTVDPDAPKYYGIKGSNKATLYGAWECWDDRPVILTEGELDAARLMQEFPAPADPSVVGVTNGVNGLTREKAAELATAEQVYIAFDQDEAGQRGYMQAAKRFVDVNCRMPRRITWPAEYGKDVTELLNNTGINYFRIRMNQAC